MKVYLYLREYLIHPILLVEKKRKIEELYEKHKKGSKTQENDILNAILNDSKLEFE